MGWAGRVECRTQREPEKKPESGPEMEIHWIEKISFVEQNRFSEFRTNSAKGVIVPIGSADSSGSNAGRAGKPASGRAAAKREGGRPGRDAGALALSPARLCKGSLFMATNRTSMRRKTRKTMRKPLRKAVRRTPRAPRATAKRKTAGKGRTLRARRTTRKRRTTTYSWMKARKTTRKSARKSATVAKARKTRPATKARKAIKTIKSVKATANNKRRTLKFTKFSANLNNYGMYSFARRPTMMRRKAA